MNAALTEESVSADKDDDVLSVDEVQSCDGQMIISLCFISHRERD